MADPLGLTVALALMGGGCFALGWLLRGAAVRTKLMGKQRAGRRTVCQKAV